jgi:hypothetical protein
MSKLNCFIISALRCFDFSVFSKENNSLFLGGGVLWRNRFLIEDETSKSDGVIDGAPLRKSVKID